MIYFDDLKWDYVLNRIYLPKDAQDDANYSQSLKEQGFQSRFEFFEGKYKNQYPEEEAKIIESWKRVFETEDSNPLNVCGNLWEIKRQWVKRIVHPGEALDE